VSCSATSDPPAPLPGTGGGPADPTLRALVAGAVAGDQHAWAELVDRFAPLLWSVCRGFRLSPTDAEDVTQAVWLRMLERLPSLRVPEALPGWLATTTRRECLRQLEATRGRAHREAPLLDEAVADERGDQVDEPLLRAERRDALRAAYDRLGERCRWLLALLLRDPPPPYAEIGVELGMPIGSIGPVRARCLETLRRAPGLAALLAADRRPEGVPDAGRVVR